jgi:hypothetical protein
LPLSGKITKKRSTTVSRPSISNVNDWITYERRGRICLEPKWSLLAAAEFHQVADVPPEVVLDLNEFDDYFVGTAVAWDDNPSHPHSR